MLNGLPERRACPSESLQVVLFVIGDTILPAACDDANPLKGQGAHSDMVLFPLFSLPLIEGSGPQGVWNRSGCKLVEGLLEVFGTDETMMNPAGLATLAGHGSNTTEAGQGAGSPTLSIFSEGDQ